MADFQYKGQGLRNVGSYQAAGWPWVTGSANLDTGKVHMIEFPMVTRAVTVINPNDSDEIRVHFQSGSSTAVTVDGEDGAQTSATGDDVILHKHYITIPESNGSMTFNVKVKRIYISNLSGVDDLKYEVFAELTSIPTGSYPMLNGSGINSTDGTEAYKTTPDDL